MSHAVFESQQRSVVRSSMIRDLVAIGRAVVYYAQLPTYLVQELNVGTVHVVDVWNLVLYNNHVMFASIDIIPVS